MSVPIYLNQIVTVKQWYSTVLGIVLSSCLQIAHRVMADVFLFLLSAQADHYNDVGVYNRPRCQ